MNLSIQVAIRCAACNNDLEVKSERVVRGTNLSTEIKVSPCQVCLDRRELVAIHPKTPLTPTKLICPEYDSEKCYGQICDECIHRPGREKP